MRIPEEVAETAEVIARARGVSINTVIVDALKAEIARVRGDEEFMTHLRSLVARDRGILDRLAE